MRRLVLAAAVIVTAGSWSADATAGSWRWPLAGEIVSRFSASDADPFAAGRRRGIAIAVVPQRAPTGDGASSVLVRSACSGRVAFAGPVGRAGMTVSVRCGRLRATYQGLAATGVRRGQRLSAGAPLGLLGRAGVLRLGARRESPRTAVRRYVDPLTLLRGVAPQIDERPACGVCLGRAPRDAPWRSPRPPASAVKPRQAPAASPAGEARPELSPLVWIGLGLLAFAAPSRVLVRRRRRARSASRALAAALRG